MRTTRLTDLYEHEGPFASVILDVSHATENGAEEHRLHARNACDSLREQGADDALVQAVAERIEEQVNEAAPVARAVVANASGVLFDEVFAAQVDQPVATYAALPDLRTWIEHQDSRVQFVLALVDHEGGDVRVYASDQAVPEQEETAGGETNHVKKFGGGGWSALRYQHVTENVWKQNAEDVAEAIQHHITGGIRLVLLGGDPHSRSIVVDNLKDPNAEVVQLEHAGRTEDGGEESLWEAVREALMEKTVTRRVELSHTLKDRLGRDEAVATGAKDVADAFVRGQVEILLFDPQEAAELSVSPSEHPGLDLGTATTGANLRADLALVAAAARTGAEVAVVPRAALGGAPVAALLRWDQTAIGTRQGDG